MAVGPADDGFIDRRAVVDDRRADQPHHLVRHETAGTGDSAEPDEVGHPAGRPCWTGEARTGFPPGLTTPAGRGGEQRTEPEGTVDQTGQRDVKPGKAARTTGRGAVRPPLASRRPARRPYRGCRDRGLTSRPEGRKKVTTHCYPFPFGEMIPVTPSAAARPV